MIDDLDPDGLDYIDQIIERIEDVVGEIDDYARNMAYSMAAAGRPVPAIVNAIRSNA